MDLHPEAEVAAGMLRRESPLGRLLFWANGRGYAGADFVIALGPYMRERILTSDSPHLVHRSLQDAFDDFAWSAAA